MKTYDYKDEQKDVKGKVSDDFLPTYHFLTSMRLKTLDRATERDHWAPSHALRLENRCERHHPQPRRSHADDREEHFQASTKC